MIELASNRYGKAAIRLVRVARSPDGDRLRDLTVAIALEGDFTAAHTDGDNTNVIATDTMKNTAYALARDHLTGSIEEFGIVLGRHFAEAHQVQTARVSIDDHAWRAIGDSPDSLSRDASETRTARVAVSPDHTFVRAGIKDLAVMKTTRSAFSGFPRDRYTTLKDTDDRIMATNVACDWVYGNDLAVDFDASFDAIRTTFLAVFAEHHSVSVQASIWIIAKAILGRHAEVDAVEMSLPNLHHWVVDLSPFGIENDREIYVSTTEPHGLIKATVRRRDG
ncbi:MAG: factor-independent urate hydroxylase [Chloroflexota bacterium]